MPLLRNHAIWALFDPKVYPNGPPPGLWIDDPQDQPSEPDIPPAQGLKTRFTKKSGSNRKLVKNAHYPSAAALEAAAQNFPDLVPPSAESLSADAPAEVLEAELKRLLGDWNRGLDVLGDLVTNVDDNIRGVGSSNGSGGGTKASDGYGRVTKKRGHGHGHGRARGTGEATDAGISIGDLSLSGNDDLDLYPPTDSTSSAASTTADGNQDSSQAPAPTAAAAVAAPLPAPPPNPVPEE